MKKILMATDLSVRSDRALQRALALAHDFGAELKIVQIVDEAFLEAIVAQHEAGAKAAMAEQLRSLPLAKAVTTSTDVIRGAAFAEILRVASEFGADLVVLGNHRHATRALFRGTTAERVVRHGRHPVLVVKSADMSSYRRTLVPSDLSPHSQGAMAVAARLVPEGEVHVIHAAHRPFTAFLGRETQDLLIRDERARITTELTQQTQELSIQLGDAAPRFTIVLREGDVRRVVRDHISSIRPELLVIGTHGRTGIAHAMIGSVAEDLLADTSVDVLVVKAT